MRKIILVIVTFAVVLILLIGRFLAVGYNSSDLEKLKAEFSKPEQKVVDHSQFLILQKKFSAGTEVTAACIPCHNQRHLEVMNSNHWNWEKPEFIDGRGIVYLGKKNIVNNFCIGIQGSEVACAKCHIGYSSDQDGLQINDPNSIDCLVCHDNSESYVKAKNKGGAPPADLDLNTIAQSVGTPQRANCGTCHFFGGGGNNVKHGDLEMALFSPSREVDVHMAIEGVDLSCIDCHTTENHKMAGKLYSISSMNRNRSSCEQCHGAAPHIENILNEHTVKVSCQTCHIPIYAKVNSTKMNWDWSTAGKMKDGKPFHLEDSLGNHTYLSQKGSFTWGRNLQPEYIWFNGTASHYLLGDKVEDPTQVLSLNSLNGSYKDSESKIIPVKIHRANQPFDPVTQLLIQPDLYASKKGEGAYWKDFDWIKAAQAGMDRIKLPFSGEVSYINTEMYWPVNHMVSSKEQTVGCVECHTRENGRLAGLTDFYMPGRDYYEPVDSIGTILIWLTLAGILAHGILRIISNKLRKNGAAQ